MELKIEEEKKKSRPQSLGEEIGNAVTHGLGFIFALVSTILMCIKADGAKAILSVVVFGLGFMFLYISSCLYHSFKTGSKVKKIFRVFDHSSIFLLIGGTYAPVLLIGVGGTIGWIFFIGQWLIIATAITLRATMPRKNTIIQVILCVLLGWSGLVFMPNLFRLSQPFFWMILIGGVVYSAGILFYGLDKRWFHFVWHFFVLGGTILHFIGIYGFLL